MYCVRSWLADKNSQWCVSVCALNGFLVVILSNRCPTCKREAHDGDLVAVNMIAAIAAIIEPLLPPPPPDQV
jgi:hypothetical protein